MLEILTPTSPYYEDKDTDSFFEKAYYRDVDFANFFLEMAAQRSFSSSDDSPNPAPIPKVQIPEMRGDAAAATAEAQAESFSPPPPADIKVYEKRPLPALPGRRNSTSSELSKELEKAFATPQRSAFFPGGDNDGQKHPARVEASNESDCEETEIRVVLDDQQRPQPARADVRVRVNRSRESEILSPSPQPQPKLAVSKLLRLTGGGPKRPSMYPVASAMSTPSGHNSKHKIQQLMGVDVAPRESTSLEQPRLTRSHWAHHGHEDDMYDSDQDVAISEGSFLDSDDDDSESEAETPSSAPVDPHRIFHSSSSVRAESPVPAPLAINKKRVVDVRPNTSGGERKLVSRSNSRYREDLYHRTTSQLSRTAWRHSGHSASIDPSPPLSASTATRDSHATSFSSGSPLIKIESNKVLSPLTAAFPRAQEEKSQVQSPEPADVASPMTSSSSPGLPVGGTSRFETPTPPRKRATSTGAFGNIGQRWQNWQQRQHQSPQPQGQYSETKLKPPYDPATDPHPGIRIILPFELEEEEFAVNSPTQSQHRQSIVSKVLKRISGSSIPSSYQGHMKRPSEPTTPTWLNSRASPTSSPIYPQPNQLPFSPTNKPAPTSIPTSVPVPDQPSPTPVIKINPPVAPQTPTPEQPQPQPTGNQRSSFTVSEPPSPILTSNGLQGRISSLGFRSPPGIRAITASSTLLAQRTNELMGQATKKLIGMKDKNRNTDKDGGSIKDKEGRAELWREGMKSRIKVLDDGGRVLGVGTEREGSVKGAVPERPERSPIVSEGVGVVFPFPFPFPFPSPGETGGEDTGAGTGTGTGSSEETVHGGGGGDGHGLTAPGVVGNTPPAVPPRSKARPISTVAGEGEKDMHDPGVGLQRAGTFGTSEEGEGETWV